MTAGGGPIVIFLPVDPLGGLSASGGQGPSLASECACIARARVWASRLRQRWCGSRRRGPSSRVCCVRTDRAGRGRRTARAEARIIGPMTDRGLPSADASSACPFVAFENERDERADRPDHRHRCYAEAEPAPRALAHQEAYCLSSAFPVCPTFQDWARREAARSRHDGPRPTESDAAAIAAGPQRNPPRNWAAPPPWASRVGASAAGSGGLRRGALDTLQDHVRRAGPCPEADPFDQLEARQRRFRHGAARHARAGRHRARRGRPGGPRRR